MINSILWLAVSFLNGLFGAILIAKCGFCWGLVDSPTKRSSHRILVPKGGGLGILSTVLIAAFWWQLPWPLWIPVCIVSLVSFLSDYREMSIIIRLIVHIVAAVVFSGYVFFDQAILEVATASGILLFVFSVLFIAGMANTFNFMDGINGIAALSGAIAFFSLGIFGCCEGKDTAWITTAFGIAAACLGFLPLNFPRAKVFMGDVGSVLLGFLFASWVIWFSRSILELIFLVSLLFTFYIDELCTFIVRIKDGDDLTKAHRRHVYQILVNQAGLSHAIVTLLYGIIQIAVILLSILIKREGLIWLVGFLVILSGLCFLGSIYVRQQWESSESYSA